MSTKSSILKRFEPNFSSVKNAMRTSAGKGLCQQSITDANSRQTGGEVS